MNNREAFEKLFPPPVGTYYEEVNDQYDTCDEHSVLCDTRYNLLWRVWQASNNQLHKELSEKEPVAFVFLEHHGGAYGLSYRGGAGQLPLIIRPTAEE